MGFVHRLVIDYKEIGRTVTNLSDGIRTVTESDNPQVAQTINESQRSLPKAIIQAPRIFMAPTCLD
jgi:hypothetical protein